MLAFHMFMFMFMIIISLLRKSSRGCIDKCKGDNERAKKGGTAVANINMWYDVCYLVLRHIFAQNMQLISSSNDLIL